MGLVFVFQRATRGHMHRLGQAGGGREARDDVPYVCRSLFGEYQSISCNYHTGSPLLSKAETRSLRVLQARCCFIRQQINSRFASSVVTRCMHGMEHPQRSFVNDLADLLHLHAVKNTPRCWKHEQTNILQLALPKHGNIPCT